MDLSQVCASGILLTVFRRRQQSLYQKKSPYIECDRFSVHRSVSALHKDQPLLMLLPLIFFFPPKDRVSLYPSWLIDQTGFHLRALPASASQVLGVDVHNHAQYEIFIFLLKAKYFCAVANWDHLSIWL